MSEKKRPVYIKIKDEDNVAITVDKVRLAAYGIGCQALVQALQPMQA